MKSYLQKKFINVLVKGLFNGITGDDILRVEGNKMFLKGKELDQELVHKLRLDAQTFHDSTLWKLLANEAIYRANERMFEKSKSIEDIMVGKSILYCVDLLRKKVKEIANL